MIKVISMILTFSIMALSIKYLGKENFGVWVLLSGIIAWSNIFDFGFEHGLRNKIAEALVKDRLDIIKSYVSTTYSVLILIAFLLLIFFIPLIILLDWKSLLNIQSLTNNDIQILIFIILFSFIIRFILKPITALLNAFQWPSIVQFIALLGLITSFLTFYILLNISEKTSIFLYASIMSASPAIILFLSSLYLYSTRFKNFIPSLTKVKYKYFKQLGSLGIAFFVIQFSGLIIFQTDNIIISKIFGPASVTDYNVAYRFFSIFLIANGIIMAPFWTAFTDAFHRNDIKWIKQTVNKLIKIILGMSLFMSFFVYFANDIYHLWIDKSIDIPISLSATVALFVAWSSFINIFTFFLNGVGKIRLQMYSSLLAAIFNIPLSYLFASILNMGIKGVLFATILSLIFTGTLSIIQYRKIINASAKGIWNR